MRYITTRKEHQCVHCKEGISEGEEVIQSESRYHLMYHPECHEERFKGSPMYAPKQV